MDDDFMIPQTFNFKKIERAVTPSLMPRHLINFNFFFEFEVSRYVALDLNLDEHSIRLLDFIGQYGPSLIRTSARVTLQKSLSFDVIREDVERVLTSLPLSYDERRQLIELAWKETYETVRTQPFCGYKVMDFDFQVQVHHMHVSGWGKISRLLSVPASDSSVRSSKKYEIDSGNITEVFCSICLEDFSGGGSEKMWLLCAHVFHGGCIKKWLRINPCCPLCRLEMPRNWI